MSLLLLLVVFRSVLAAVKAGVMNLLSVFAADGGSASPPASPPPPG